jgi:hypothetical protein
MDPFEQFVDFATNTVRQPSMVSGGLARQSRRTRMPRSTPGPGGRRSGSRISILSQRPRWPSTVNHQSRVRGLGAISVPGEIAATGSLVGTATSLAAETGLVAVGSAIPIAGTVIAAIAGIAAALGLGQGCGSSCIEAAQQEQVFEAAADNIYRVAKAGMIPGTIAAQLIQALIPLAQQAEAAQGTKASGAGASNAAKVIQNEASAAAALGSTISQPLNLSAAQAQFIGLNTSGWYPQALATAQQLAVQILQTYANSAPSMMPASTTGAPATGSSLAVGGPQAVVATAPAMIPTTTASASTIGGLSTTELLAIAAAIVAVMFL